ncbi:DUF4406 domain-containing protein [Pseudomonas cichorii]|uniref:DUF4406 domain-containing protein n=1 Tax=Pseudomonas cichorii TaxID=36746 RepID=UPI001C8949BF|nr:DUF4406 domain-containing protein [Pseudomonas cichorii]MBX8528501.1 DUF4406 domain-containing protein [Pseudomonas cichorii]
MSKIYLSGPMTGLPDLNFPAFNAESARLRGLGFDVANPAELNPEGASWGDCMRKDIVALMSCDTVATLPGWEHSKGARLEVLIGERLEMTVVKAQDLVPPPAILSVGQAPAVGGELERLSINWGEQHVEKDRFGLYVTFHSTYRLQADLQSERQLRRDHAARIHELSDEVKDLKGEVERLKNELGVAKGEYDRSVNRRTLADGRSAELERLLRIYSARGLSPVLTEGELEHIDAVLGEGKEHG